MATSRRCECPACTILWWRMTSVAARYPFTAEHVARAALWFLFLWEVE